MLDENIDDLANTKTNIKLKLLLSSTDFSDDAEKLKSKIITVFKRFNILDSDISPNFCSTNILRQLDAPLLADESVELADKYNVSEEILFTLMGFQVNNSPENSAIVIELGVEDHVTISIYPWAKEQDLRKHWQAIEEQLRMRKGYRKRYRAPMYLPLLVKLHSLVLTRKANGKKINWKQIATDVNNDELEGYKTSEVDKSTWEEATIKKHYHDYKHLLY